MNLEIFANNTLLTSVAAGLIVLQTFWWWQLLKKTKDLHPLCKNWVLYASQSGQAHSLAEQTAKQLSQSQQTWQVASLANWQRQHDLTALNEKTILFIVSTQGEGDPPDNGTAFWQTLSTNTIDLSRLNFAVLGLGDSRYKYFCGFAHKIQKQLQQYQASPLFELTTIDNLNAKDIQLWYQHLANNFHLRPSSSATLPHVQTSMAKLIIKQCENSGGRAPFLFHLQFTIAQPLQWQAGDIADLVIPTEDCDHLRHYTIANVMAKSQKNTEQTISLLVRQVKKDSGELGIGSGYLTRTLKIGETVKLSIRSNPKFYLPDNPTPLILIATGSGLAGILALLAQAETNWKNSPSHHLIYGERYPDSDTPCRKQLTHYQNNGLLKKVDYCFSRQETNNPYYSYVQDALMDQATYLKNRINHGAMVYVCGSKDALQDSIPKVLTHCLGELNYQQLIARNGLRLDVY